MSENEQTLLMIKGAIVSMPIDGQKTILETAQKIRELIKEHGDHGIIALTLVGAEEAAK